MQYNYSNYLEGVQGELRADKLIFAKDDVTLDFSYSLYYLGDGNGYTLEEIKSGHTPTDPTLEYVKFSDVLALTLPRKNDLKKDVFIIKTSCTI